MDTIARHDGDGATTAQKGIAGDPVRLACVVGGGLLALLGARRGGPLGVGLALAGGAVAFRGATGGGGEGAAGGALQAGLQRLERALPATSTLKVARSVTIGRPRAEVWRYIRDFAGFPRWAWHVESVTPVGQGQVLTHWVVRAPGGTRLEWDAEVVNEVEEERVSWQSAEGADIRNAGVIILRDAPGGRGTELTLRLAYDAPGGTLGRAVARLLGEEPDFQARDDLRRLKQLLETDEISTNAMRREAVGRENF